MPANSNKEETCPICLVTIPQSVRCPYAACSFAVVVCPRCDKGQAVEAFVADHMKDCAHGPSTHLLAQTPRFVAPRRAA